MIGFDRLVRYVSGLESAEPDAALERALFTSPELSPAVAELLALVDTARSLGERGPIVPVLHPDQLTALQATRSVVVATVVAGVVQVGLTAQTDFVVARVPIPDGVPRRFQVTFRPPVGPAYFRVRDAPYDPREGHILVCCERHVALAAADVRLCVEDAQGHIFTEARLLASPV